jgi:GMP synthase (glutamine-hydrolysing)
MNVDEVDRHPFLARERALVRTAIAARTPLMGVCLGAQVMARALDQPVVRAPVRQIGFSPVYPTDEGVRDQVASVLSPGDAAFHWNEDTFDLPPGATKLASGPDGSVQLYRVGSRAWGILFHPEIDATELDGWLEEAGSDVRRVWGRSAEELREEAGLHLDEHERRGRELFRRFARCVRESAAP